MMRQAVCLSLMVVLLTCVAMFSSPVSVHADIPEELVLYYTFDTEDKGTITDLSGNGNNANIKGQPEWVAGKIGDALKFGANGQSLEVPDSDTLKSDEITIALWVNWSGETLPNHFIEKFTYLSGGYVFKMENTETNLWLYDENAAAHMYRARPQPVPGEWTHLAVTFDGSVQKGYVNGIKGLDMPWVGAIGHVNVPLNMGAHSGMTFTGMLDEVAIYSRALTDEEILDTMENGHIIAGAVRPMDKLSSTWGRLKKL
ncbi:LamG domain-containing protein [Candidatus Poribacteria bacterium]